MKCLLKSLCQVQCAEVPRAVFCLEMRTFLRHLFGRQLCPSPIHLPRQTRSFQPSQANVLWTKERNDTGRQTSKR